MSSELFKIMKKTCISYQKYIAIEFFFSIRCYLSISGEIFLNEIIYLKIS